MSPPRPWGQDPDQENVLDDAVPEVAAPIPKRRRRQMRVPEGAVERDGWIWPTPIWMTVMKEETMDG
jgi:hypothetical protein